MAELFSSGEQPRHMSSAVYVVRAFLANLIALPPSRLYRTFFDRNTGQNHELQVGDCRFWGPEEFTSACCSAMAELESADKQMFDRLTSSGAIMFWLKPATLKERVYHKKARYYSIETTPRHSLSHYVPTNSSKTAMQRTVPTLMRSFHVVSSSILQPRALLGVVTDLVSR